MVPQRKVRGRGKNAEQPRRTDIYDVGLELLTLLWQRSKYSFIFKYIYTKYIHIKII